MGAGPQPVQNQGKKLVHSDVGIIRGCSASAIAADKALEDLVVGKKKKEKGEGSARRSGVEVGNDGRSEWKAS